MTITITDAGINVQITRETRAPSQRGFGTLMFLHEDGAVTPSTRVKAYTSFAGVAEDFNSADEPYKAALNFYGQNPSPIDFKVGRYDPAEAIQDELDAMVDVDSDFYCVCPNVNLRDTTKIEDISTWVLANERVLFHTSNDALVKDSIDVTNIMYTLQQSGDDDTCGFYSSEVDEYPCAAAFAVFATTSYRGINTLKTLKFKDLVGITTEGLTVNELQAVKGFYCNVVYTVAGIKMVDDGITAGGSWIDEIIGTDALREEIRVRVFGLLSRQSTKIPYNERGMSLLKTEVEGSLLQYRDNGFLSERVDLNGDILPAYTVTSKPVILASAQDKSDRIAPDIEFRARVAGAVHEILINGTLVLD